MRVIDSRADFYQKLRVRMKTWLASDAGKRHRWADLLFFAPDLFHLLWKLSTDPRVPMGEKTRLGMALVYFVSPLDLVPEALFGPAGYVDDIALAALILNGLINRSDPLLVRMHWAGEDDVLLVLQRILRVAGKMVGAGVWSKLRRRG